MFETMKRDFFSLGKTPVTHIAPPIIGRVGVHCLGVCPFLGYTDSVSISHNRGKIEYTYQVVLFSETNIGDHACIGVVTIDP